ncbi:PREDICTED: forkhead box protein R1 [Galeopterus variegatus]|uniref:Forkhead box protein R1 n=1 Tax=Galeopterus variegatus TaxID=482537 RepID=A0ABM0R697_GALVR|nr:PREDICTED: forkhead box protein R1 [Galeopterus variegatus]
MGNESFLAFTTAHLPLAEQNLARYRLRVVDPPRLPLEKKPKADEDGPDFEPNLWMWVNPNIVYPPGKVEAPEPSKTEDLTSTLPSPQPPLKEEDATCSEAMGVESLLHSSGEQHFPFFRTAPEGWKNTVRHNLCFRDSFEKVPVGAQGGAGTRPRSCLWKLTEEGHRRFAEEARAWASTRLESIQQCMSQPDVMPFLFDL